MLFPCLCFCSHQCSFEYNSHKRSLYFFLVFHVSIFPPHLSPFLLFLSSPLLPLSYRFVFLILFCFISFCPITQNIWSPHCFFLPPSVLFLICSSVIPHSLLPVIFFLPIHPSSSPRNPPPLVFPPGPPATFSPGRPVLCQTRWR